MDILKKVELLLSAKARSALPRRKRHSMLDDKEEELLAEIRQALSHVEAQERVLAERLKTERAEAEIAAERGDRIEQRAHERRATELEQKLEAESTQAINLEEKLAALEEKLLLAKEAVEKEAKKVATKEAEASKVLAGGGHDTETEPEQVAPVIAEEEIIPDDFAEDEPDMAARKSRLSGLGD